MITEADTCRKYVLPKLTDAGWETDPHSITEQHTFTDGRIIVAGSTVRRLPKKRADYLLRLTRDFTIAVVEAKPAFKLPSDGLQQAKEYAEALRLKFSYSTNGHGIVEFDFITGKERELSTFPTPDELWFRLQHSQKIREDAIPVQLSPYNQLTGRKPRYYQDNAINEAIRAILQGKRRILLTMATGTGKTEVAFQLCWKLWSSKWNARNDPTRKPRILYLADRNFLVDDPKDKTFASFGDARYKIEGGATVLSREMYFTTYQSIAKDEHRPGLYKEFPRNFFDLVIVDECHRGSARDDSNWREILEYFESTYQLGMTATPLREENKDTYLYFGNPVYTYSLRQGIEDGFLAPYRVHRVITQWDAEGWRPSKGDLDRYQREIPDELYGTEDFERRVALKARTQAVAAHLTDFLKKTDRFAKTIVFCVDQDHADEMRRSLTNLNSDLAKQYPDYVCRVTADEGEIGRGHMQRFQDVETRTPVILTTSQLLTTGLDAPTCRNVVLVRLVNSMVEFKQIIGRGTRVREDYGKVWFNILDYTGSATKNFADPSFDGDPVFATREEIDEFGKTKSLVVETAEENTVGGTRPEETVEEVVIDSRESKKQTKYYYDGGQVTIVAEMVHELDVNGKQLRVVKLTDYTAENVRTLCANADELRARWINTDDRAEIIQQLSERGVEFNQIAALAGTPDADPFDLLCHLAFKSPIRTRRQRADRVKRQEIAFFNYYGPEAREILNELLEKYSAEGELQFTLPDILKVPPFSDRGNVEEIIEIFGNATALRTAIGKLQSLLYAQ